MARLHFPELLPGDDSLERRIERLRQFWSDVDALEDPGAISWEVWDDYRFRVTDWLYKGTTPEHVQWAEWLTGEVLFHYLAGNV